ncbi:MAG: chromosome segregation protein SMC [Oscillospiraceae bacterium]|nr:chromosome segregation protein SMC [Oscillospiraceae bacterium]
MYFKTLEIQGFKSFPDKTVLTFDTRTTAVVGSNGNGKSNISDALRWVMGEQGAKTLRGDKMEDVIFYGTQTRKPMGFAKVTLTIDNSDRCLPLDSDEVAITRKLYRTGDSEYIINGEKSRLKDIGSLFMGTGLGRDGYSIIGQGRIDEIINSKAAGRREIFEEAAGVSKFLHKKAQAKRELERTDENLLRLLDIETELKTRLPVLEKQSEKAKKAFELQEEERALSVALSVKELERIDKDIEHEENTILLNQGQCEHFDREIVELEADSESISDAKRDLAAETDRLRRQGESAKDDIAESDKQVALMENDIVHNNVSADILRSRADEKDSELKQQIKDEATIIAEQAEKKQELQSKTATLKTALAEAIEEKSENENKLSGYSRLYETKAVKRDEAHNQLDDIKREHHQKKTRLDILLDVERSMSGYFSSVKAVMSAAKSGRFGRCVSGSDINAGSFRDASVYGTVADIINVEKEYSTAVEIALGSALQNVIVANESVAKRCISFLKENKSGRATFLPLTSIRGNVLELSALYMEDGFIGMGHEIVKHHPDFSEIIKSLLGRTAFAEDIDSATVIAKKYGYKFKVVTLDGQVINAGGSFTGGSVKKSEGIISRKRETTDLQSRLDELAEKIQPAKARYEQLAAECAKMKLECEGMRENITKFSSEEIRLNAELDGVNNLIRQFQEQLENSETALERYKAKIAEERDRLQQEITELNAKNAALEIAIREKREHIEKINALTVENKEEIAALIQKSMEYEKRGGEILVQIREKIGHKEKFSNALATAIERKSGLITKAEEIKATLFDEYELTTTEAIDFVNAGGESCAVSDIKEARAKLNDIKKKLSALGNVNFAAIEEFTEVKERYDVLSTQLSDVRGSKSELEKLIAELTEDIRTRFLHSFNDISGHFSRIFTEIFGGGTARLELADSDGSGDVLSAGIEIYAAPPGKLIKSLMALSGGEKALVAITLYFAILMHRPTPFCMLDEVDAALDEVNVAKYINYLSRYSDTTQLMMITHRRPTIERCDVLYGVFMQEKGVSRLLKQEING